MGNNKQNSTIIIGMLVIVVFFILIMSNFSLKNKYQRLHQDVTKLQYEFERVSQQLNSIIEMNSIISDSEYKVEKIEESNKVLGKVRVDITSNKLGSYTGLKLLYRTIYDSTKSNNFDYSKNDWQYVELGNNKGTYSADFIVPFSCDYELKISYEENSKINYEQLPNLDLYRKSELAFMKDINIYGVKKSKLEFDVQISKFKDDTKLLSSVCNVYYDGDTVDIIDILKENEVSGRKEPKAQLEHLEGDYWFIIQEVDFGNIDKFDKAKVEIEVILEDSLGNIYKLIRGID